ncbi:MAG: sigma-54-dependent Fis family transcriptional regulator [bacterium]|nr:sigma-54-dependent Fis family transcriptional regulator [bacterium]
MLELIKDRIWNILSKKEVSLVMIYDMDGNILWHRGRKITGRTVHEGEGFSKTYIKKAFEEGEVLETKGLMLSSKSVACSESILFLHIKSLLINRIAESYFLYIDSGNRESFTNLECEMFRFQGDLLGDVILQIKKKEAGTGGITGTSENIKGIREHIVTYAMVDEPILLTGETGTGKTHIAELIHRYSGKKGKFVIINTPGIPDSLFESEMFGHKKGAFTDAKFDKKGLVEEAAGGTLFVDEITEVSINLQAKLLRFIETGKYTRLGESTERKVDVRIVAASNKILKTAIKKQEFREDLYYRLNVFEIELPPLRKRKKDLESLVMEMQELLRGKKMGDGFWKALKHHNWPGNVRELISVLKRAGVHKEDVITGKDIAIILNVGSQPHEPDESSDKSPPDNEVERLWNEIKAGGNFWDIVKTPYMNRDLRRSDVKEIVSKGLVETNGKYKKLVKLFNMEKNDYHRLMRFFHEQNLISKEE